MPLHIINVIQLDVYKRQVGVAIAGGLDERVVFAGTSALGRIHDFDWAGLGVQKRDWRFIAPLSFCVHTLSLFWLEN